MTDPDAALESLAVEMREVLDDAAAVAPHSEPVDHNDYLPTAQEMLDAAKRQTWKLLTGDQKTPAHVMAKAVDLGVRIAAVESEQDPAEATDTTSVFEMIESLPLARGIELLERKEQSILAELEAVRTRRSGLLQQQDREVAGQVA